MKKITTQANLEIDHTSSGSETKQLTKSSESEDDKIGNVRQDLLNRLLSPGRNSNNNNTHTTVRPLQVEAKVNIKCNKLASGVSKLAKDDNQSTRAEDVIQPPYKGSRATSNVNGT